VVFPKLKRFGLRKEERLCSLKRIGRLFSEGKNFYQYPLRIVFLILDKEAKIPVQAAFSVSKKNIRKAVDRNLLRRRMKEAYRLNKPVINEGPAGFGLAVMFIYTAREILAASEIEKAMKIASLRLGKIVNKQPS